MPSPFPGMDPFLEKPARWADVHHRLISAAGDLLGGAVRPKYFVRIEERVYISDDKDPGRSVIVPELRIVAMPEKVGHAFVPGGGTALDVAEPITITTLIADEIHEARLEIIDAEDQHVVTAIEIVSPASE